MGICFVDCRPCGFLLILWRNYEDGFDRQYNCGANLSLLCAFDINFQQSGRINFKENNFFWQKRPVNF